MALEILAVVAGAGLLGSRNSTTHCSCCHEELGMANRFDCPDGVECKDCQWGWPSSYCEASGCTDGNGKYRKIVRMCANPKCSNPTMLDNHGKPIENARDFPSWAFFQNYRRL